jgi:hypothetical protein
MLSQKYRLGRTAIIIAAIAWIFGQSELVMLFSIIGGILIITSDELR